MGIEQEINIIVLVISLAFGAIAGLRNGATFTVKNVVTGVLDGSIFAIAVLVTISAFNDPFAEALAHLPVLAVLGGFAGVIDGVILLVNGRRD